MVASQGERYQNGLDKQQEHKGDRMNKSDAFPRVFNLALEWTIQESACDICDDGKTQVCLVYEYDGGYAWPSVCKKHIDEAFRRHKLECR